MAADLAYDGTDFSGWARQDGLRTVQGELEAWLARILRLAEPVSLVCAGRTDTGVHARGQVAHVDLEQDAVEDVEALAGRLNRVLPDDLIVLAMSPAPDGFDARFSAQWRRYVYRFSDGPPVDPLQRRQVTALRRAVDLDRFNAAGATLLGLRDFGAFCRPRDGATTVRTLLELRAERVASGPLAGVVECTVRADAFCHSMVRSLVGALVEVGVRPPRPGLAEQGGRPGRTRSNRSRAAARRTDVGGGRLSRGGRAGRSGRAGAYPASVGAAMTTISRITSVRSPAGPNGGGASRPRSGAARSP